MLPVIRQDRANDQGTKICLTAAMGLPQPRDPAALIPFLEKLLPRWIGLWIERDPGIPGRRGRSVKVPVAAEPFDGSANRHWKRAYGHIAEDHRVRESDKRLTLGLPKPGPRTIEDEANEAK